MSRFLRPYLLACFFFSLCIFPVLAQDTSLYQVKIDSLQTLIRHQPKADTNTVKRLNYLARICFYDMQYQRGLLATLEARRLAKKLHYAKGDALYWRTMAIFDAAPLGYYYYNFWAKWFYSDRKQQEEIVQLGVTYPSKPDLEKIKSQMLDALHYFEKYPDSNREILANLLVSSIGFMKPEEQAPYIAKVHRELRENKLTIPLFFLRALDMVYSEQKGNLEESKEAEIEARSIIANTKNEREVALMKHFLSYRYANLGRTNASFELTHQVEQILEKIGEKELRIDVLARLAQICFGLSLHKKAIDYYKKQALLTEENRNRVGSNLVQLTYIYHQIAFSYIRLKEFDQAKLYIEKARKAPTAYQLDNQKKFNTTRHYDAMGQLLMGQANYHEALKNFAQAHDHARQTAEASWLAPYMTYYSAQCYQKLGQLDESIRFGKLCYDKVLPIVNTVNGRTLTSKSSLLLAEVYEEAKQPLEAYNYLKMYQKLRNEDDKKEEANHFLDTEIRSVVEKDEQEKNRLKEQKLIQDQHILAIEKQREIDGLKAQAANQLLQTRAEQAELDKKLEKERLEAEARQNKRQQDYKISLLNLDINNQRKIRLGLLSGLALFALFVVALFRQNRIKQRLNQTLSTQKSEIEHQKEEITTQRDYLEETLTDLKKTQTQLIQKEKLASLGELTAGIAHEIQNPLNFVNNFSEVSSELIEEQKEALAKGDLEEAQLIANDLTSNLQKINHHGGRASSIVKGMLEHSRTESGEKRPTDLNALADEYLKIAYHGLRAKDKAFNCELITDFDSSLGKVDVAPQEIGRVLLNLYNNAFYAVSERQKQDGNDFHPRVRVTTKRLANSVEIRVRDNGTGISESVKAKIFQPFFTTKPTGEGTGLGLSLSYDIVTKGHGGTITVESQEGNGTSFFIQLPIA